MAAHGFEPWFVIHVPFQFAVVFLVALHLTEMGEGRGGIGILFVPGADPAGTQQVVLPHDTEIIIEQFAVAARTGSGFDDRHTKNNGGGDTIYSGKGIGERAELLNEAARLPLCTYE